MIWSRQALLYLYLYLYLHLHLHLHSYLYWYLYLRVSHCPPGLSVHETSPCPCLLPAVIILDEGGDALVRQHLADPVEALAVELEGLLEQNLVLNTPLVREGGEVGQVL